MSDYKKKNENANRLEKLSVDQLMSQYAPGKNPSFKIANGNMFSPDPRIPANPIKTHAYNAAMAIVDNNPEFNVGLLNKEIEANPDCIKMEYKSNPGGMSLAIVNFKRGDKGITLLTPPANVMKSSVQGDVCMTYTDQMVEKTCNPSDHESILQKTDWNFVITGRTIDGDAPEKNEFNYPFLKFMSDLRVFEKNVIRMIAIKMIASYDDDEGECTFLKELAHSKDIRKALASGDVNALVDEILKDTYVSVTKSTPLKENEISTFKRKYKEKNGKIPTDDYMAMNVTSLYDSDKLSMKTKQFQKSNKPFDANKAPGYTEMAKTICGANPGYQWVKPAVFDAEGEELPFANVRINTGDAVALYFNPSFMVYKTNGKIYCSLSVFWNASMIFFSQRKVMSGSGSRVAVKKMKLENHEKISFASVTASHRIDTATEEEEQQLDLDEY